jgi:hypothetical protein
MSNSVRILGIAGSRRHQSYNRARPARGNAACSSRVIIKDRIVYKNALPDGPS